MKIGFFDSGLGGLTILNEALKQINADYIYLADNKNTPYGIKEKTVVKGYIFDNVEKLINKGCKIIVIACNTATSIAINELRAKYKDACIIGTEPAVKVAVDDCKVSNILVCATTRTIKEEKLSNLISNLEAKDKVKLLALDDLVKFAEQENTSQYEVEQYLLDKLSYYDLNELSHVVLGCTHFPLFKDYFVKIFPEDTQIIDGSIGIVNNLKDKIKDNRCSKSTIELLLTKESDVFVSNYKKISGYSDLKIEVI